MASASLKALLKEEVLDLRKINKVTKNVMQRPKMQKTFFKLMTKVWSEDEDSRRILALINILKALDIKPECTSLCIKLMFLAYVRNCKFVLGSTLPLINFMRQSLLEVLSRNLDEAYLHAFAYIRQLAIGLRKAHTSHSKDDAQAVQNWQFINSLRLWTDLVAKHAVSHQLIHSLVHPLVQIIVATTKLSSGERWIPLRFHCVSMLHTLAGVPLLSENSGSDTANPVQKSTSLVGLALSPTHRVLVPSLPLLLDIFQLVNFNRRASSASKAPLDLRLLLHFSPSQRRETASLDAVVSWLIDLLTEAAAIQANSLVFPEYALAMMNALKQFVHTCRVSAFTRQAKALLTKVRDHSDWMAQQRRRLRNLTNPNDVVQLESALTVLDGSVAAPPFWSFYINHKQVRATELAHLTKCHKKDMIPSEDTDEKFPGDRKNKKTKQRASVMSGLDDDDESESSDSDASYDYDDGVTVTHVSKSKGKSTKPDTMKQPSGADKRPPKVSSGPDQADEEAASEESDFDLEAALNEPDEGEQEDSESDGAAAPDQVTDFELSDSEDEYEQDDEELEEDEEDESSESEQETGVRSSTKAANSQNTHRMQGAKRGPKPSAFRTTTKRHRSGQPPHHPAPKKLKLTGAKVKNQSAKRGKK